MAVTQYQQYLADKSQTPNDPEECCLAMGGTVDLLNQTCTTGTQSFYLENSCGFASAVAENSPDANQQQSGGGIGAWLSSNLETIVQIGQGIGQLFGATPPPPTSPGPTQPEKDNTKTFIAVAVAIFVVVVAIVLIRKSRK